jgi:hypothetical protein
MRIASVCLVLSAISCVHAVAGAANSNTAQSQPVMALAISAAQDSVKIGAPVRIQVALTNKSDRDVTFSRDGAGYDCRLDVRDINGNLLADSKFGYLRNGHVAHPDPTRFSPEDLKGRLVVVTVKAGQTLTWEEDAAKLYEIDPPGEYTIQGQEPEPGNMSVSLKSNTITVTVTP